MELDFLATGLSVPFAGTVLGAACVYFMRRSIGPHLEKALVGFAAGVMVAASVWSLLIPAIECGPAESPMRIVPPAVGFLAGILFLLLIDALTPHQHMHTTKSEGLRSHLSRHSKLFLAVTIHNIPEGIAVGIMLAGALDDPTHISTASALVLAAGIAIQNFPEGAVVAMPLHTAGMSRNRAFAFGSLSGLVEPVAAALTLLIAQVVLPVFPYLLAFGAGAMLYVVVEELIPQASQGSHSNIATIAFAIGFVLMMTLDVGLG